jgi:hypothetical protein
MFARIGDRTSKKDNEGIACRLIEICSASPSGVSNAVKLFGTRAPHQAGAQGQTDHQGRGRDKGACHEVGERRAVVVGEAIGGSEEEFAKLMTLKARALGMTSTTYVNASGLPAEKQITTARDLRTAHQQRTTLMEASPPPSDGTL